MKEKISYDPENDVLYYNKGQKSQDSLEVGNLFIEFSSSGQVVGMEIVDATETIKELTGEEFSSEDLKSIENAGIKVHTKKKYAFIRLDLQVKRDQERVKESVGINLPSSTVAA